MGSLADYIKELQTDYAKNNIYSQLGGSILGADVNVRGGSPYVNFATNLLKGLAGGGLNQMALADAREYNTGINSVFSDVLGGQSVRPIEGLSSGELGDLITAANIFKQQQANERDVLTKAADIEGIRANKITLGQLNAQNESYNKMGGNPLLNPNHPLSKQVQQEVNILESKKDSLDFITNGFEKAKELVGPGAAISTAIGGRKEELTGLGDSLIFQIDKAFGREINDDVRRRMLNLTPKWYDNAEQLEVKQKALKDLLNSVSAPTPTLDKLGVSSEPISNTPKSSSSITPEQARALLKQKGIPGY